MVQRNGPLWLLVLLTVALRDSCDEPPVVTMNRRMEVEDGMETYICRVHGFYPREINAFWTRDGEVWLQDTFRGSVAPNADGTYHYWTSIQIDPKERGCYRCHVEHNGLLDPLDLELKEPNDSKSNLWFIIGCVVAAVVIVGGIAGLLVFLKKRQDGYKAASKPPVVTMSSWMEVEDGMETHVCRVHGFYPREIDASWTRDGEVWLQDTFRAFLTPNADRTYHYWTSIQIDPKERGHYRCHVEHDGLQDPLDLKLMDPRDSKVLIICVAAAVVLVCVIVVIIGVHHGHSQHKERGRKMDLPSPELGRTVRRPLLHAGTRKRFGGLSSLFSSLKSVTF